MSLASLLAMFSGAGSESGEFAQLESDAKALVSNLTSVMTALVNGKGDIVATIIGVVEDLGAIRSALTELVAIAADVRAIATGAAGVVASTAAVPGVVTNPAPVSSPAPAVTSTSMAATALQALAAVKALDPFIAKPLAVKEPQGGA